jgi:hypothetical protein
MVLMDQPTEDLGARDHIGRRWRRARDRAADIVRRAKTEPAVRSMRVVMRGVPAQHVHWVSSVKDQHVIEHFPW